MKESNKYFFLGRVFYDLESSKIPFWRFLTNEIHGIGILQAQRISWLIGLSTSTSLFGVSLSQRSCKNLLFRVERLVGMLIPAYGRTLSRFVENNINFEVKRGSIRGSAFKFGLPVRGQRTKSNARTAKRWHKSKVFSEHKLVEKINTK